MGALVGGGVEGVEANLLIVLRGSAQAGRSPPEVPDFTLDTLDCLDINHKQGEGSDAVQLIAQSYLPEPLFRSPACYRARQHVLRSVRDISPRLTLLSGQALLHHAHELCGRHSQR